MKPSTYDKLKKFKLKLRNLYYKLFRPLALLDDKLSRNKVNRYAKYSNAKLAKSIAKKMYKDMLKCKYDRENYVFIADRVDSDYNDPYSILHRYTEYNSKEGQVLRIQKFYKDKKSEELLDKVLKYFDNINEYTYVYDEVEHQDKIRWRAEGYIKTIHFGIKQ